MNKPLIYALKVWVTALFVSPLIIMITGLMPAGSFGDVILMLFCGVIIGLIFSALSAFLFWLSIYVITENLALKTGYQKGIISIIGIVLTGLAFLLFSRQEGLGNSEKHFALVYASVIVISTWMYTLQPETKEDFANDMIESTM